MPRPFRRFELRRRRRGGRGGVSLSPWSLFFFGLFFFFFPLFLLSFLLSPILLILLLLEYSAWTCIYRSIAMLSLARVSPAKPPRLLHLHVRPRISPRLSLRCPAPRYTTARCSSTSSKTVATDSPAPFWTTGRALLLSAFAGAGAYAYAVSGGSVTEKQPQYGSTKDLEKVDISFFLSSLPLFLLIQLN